MTEPLSSAGVTVAVKFYGVIVCAAVAAILAYTIVVMTRLPRSREEWVVSLISTVIGSITGGAFIIQRFELHHYADNYFGILAITGITFICGLPIWAIVRWTFNYINAKEDATIFEIAKEVKENVKELHSDDK